MTKALTAQLSLKLPNHHILNAGQPGHSTFQSYELFMETLGHYKPKVDHINTFHARPQSSSYQ